MGQIAEFVKALHKGLERWVDEVPIERYAENEGHGRRVQEVPIERDVNDDPRGQAAGHRWWEDWCRITKELCFKHSGLWQTLREAVLGLERVAPGSFLMGARLDEVVNEFRCQEEENGNYDHAMAQDVVADLQHRLSAAKRTTKSAKKGPPVKWGREKRTARSWARRFPWDEKTMRKNLRAWEEEGTARKVGNLWQLAEDLEP